MNHDNTSPFPHEVVESPLTRDLASRHGISDYQLASGSWPTRFRGVHRWTDVDPLDPLHRIREVASILPAGGAITGWAAGYLHGVTEFDGRARDGTTLLPVPVALQPEVQTRRRTGLIIIRSRLEPDDLCTINGISCTRPLRACFDGMRKSDLVEAVVVADIFLGAALFTGDDLWTYNESRPRWRGRPLVRRAIGLADPLSRSPQESRLRMLWVLEAGLPRPLVNVPVLDTAGNLLGYPDLLDPEAGLVGEYDGSSHAELESRTLDHVREERLERSGLITIRFTSLDLNAKYRRRTAIRIRRERSRGMNRDRRLDRWRLGG